MASIPAPSQQERQCHRKTADWEWLTFTSCSSWTSERDVEQGMREKVHVSLHKLDCCSDPFFRSAYFFFFVWIRSF